MFSAQHENLGPSESEEADFAKELAKMVSDSGDTRKVDKRTALALWDTSTTLPGGLKKKRVDDADNAESEKEGIMKFTFMAKKGNKVQVCRFSLDLQIFAKFLLSSFSITD